MAEPTVRSAEADDLERLSEIAQSSFTSTYALSPNDIETIAEVELSAEALGERLDSGDGSVFVAELEDGDEEGDVLAGFVTHRDGEIDWLHVDPERRGLGVGTALFEHALHDLEDEADDDEISASALAANNSSGRFFERFDFEQVEERQTEIGERDVVEYVFQPGGAVSDAEAEDDSDRVSDADEPVIPTERDDLDLPEEAEADGQTVYLGDESLAGSEGGFVVTFADEEESEEYGYYCVNCGSTDVSMDSMERIRCADCGNTHKSEEDYDGSYL